MKHIYSSKSATSELTSNNKLMSSIERWNVGLTSECAPRFILYADGYRARTHKNRKLD